MARSTKTTKKLASRKRRERKNIERGQVHIRSSFNNTLVTVTDLNGNAISWASAGASASAVPVRALRLPHRWQRKPQQKLQWNTACVSLKFTSRAPAQVVNLQSVRSRLQVLKST